VSTVGIQARFGGLVALWESALSPRCPILLFLSGKHDIIQNETISRLFALWIGDK
jgi:hypothetical protein